MEALKRNEKLTVNKTTITKFHLGKLNHVRSRGGAHHHHPHLQVVLSSRVGTP